jgi:hypothetical protein
VQDAILFERDDGYPGMLLIKERVSQRKTMTIEGMGRVRDFDIVYLIKVNVI